MISFIFIKKTLWRVWVEHNWMLQQVCATKIDRVRDLIPVLMQLLVRPSGLFVFTIGIGTETSTNGKVINSLTAIRVLVGTKNSHPVEFYSRNSTKSTVNHKHNNPQTLPPWWCRLPLIWRGIHGSARSDARNLFCRGRAGGWRKRII